MYTYPWYHWITFFYIYCFCGWIFESTYVSLKSRRYVNRGFLRLPMLPLYGTGAIMMLWVSLPLGDNLILVYLAGVAAATVLEYVTGFVMERLFKMKYWDYSSHRFQLQGYICLSSSVAWGFLTIFLTDVIHQPIARLVLSISPLVEFTLIGIVSIFFVTDAVKSTREALDLGRALEALTKLRAEAEEVQVQLALLKAETTQKMADIKRDATQMVSELKDDASMMVSELRDGAAWRVTETAHRVRDYRDREMDLSERLKTLTEHYQKLTHHMTFYRKGILRGNPSASSKRFAAALKELKEAMDSRRS